MPDHDERRRILDMLAAGQVTTDEAAALLGALDAAESGAATEEARVTGKAARKIARSLRIDIDSGNEDARNRGRVVVTVPLSLAKFAGRLIPEEVRNRLEDEGIGLTDLLQELDQELPEGRLLDIDTAPDGDESRRARIVVEVV